MAPKTKPRTTKKPASAPRKRREATPTTRPPATAEDIGRSIGDALGRRLENLLAKPDKPEFDAVSAWTVEKLGDGVTGYRANCAIVSAPTHISPVEEAIGNLRSAVTHAEVITDRETERLDSVLAPTAPATAATDIQKAGGYPSLANAIQALAERIHADNFRRSNMLDRLEL